MWCEDRKLMLDLIKNLHISEAYFTFDWAIAWEMPETTLDEINHKKEILKEVIGFLYPNNPIKEIRINSDHKRGKIALVAVMQHRSKKKGDETK